jgi:hypothetical protein
LQAVTNKSEEKLYVEAEHPQELHREVTEGLNHTDDLVHTRDPKNNQKHIAIQSLAKEQQQQIGALHSSSSLPPLPPPSPRPEPGPVIELEPSLPAKETPVDAQEPMVELEPESASELALEPVEDGKNEGGEQLFSSIWGGSKKQEKSENVESEETSDDHLLAKVSVKDLISGNAANQGPYTASRSSESPIGMDYSTRPTSIMSNQPRPEDRNYIDDLATNLFAVVHAFEPNRLTLEHISHILPDLLKTFALKVGYKPQSSMHLDVSYFIFKYCKYDVLSWLLTICQS